MLKAVKKTAIRGHEEPAHVDIFVEYYDLMKRWALQFTERDPERAEDLLHDAFIQFTLSKPDLDTIRDLESYLFIVMRNLHLSQLRRASRSALRPLTLAEYDTVQVSFWSSDPRDRMRMRDDLGAICQYACIRKESSKAGSVLILRFFHGYYPEEIASLLRSNRSAVEKRLRMARAEAKVYLEDSEKLAFIGDKERKAARALSGSMGGDLRLELRGRIFASRHGECFPEEELNRMYGSDPGDGLDHRTVAHIVSCGTCIDRVNDLLGLAPLASRYPVDTVGKDPGGKGGGGKAGGGTSGGGPKMLDPYFRRREVHFHHQPQELHISVNGQLQGSQKIVGGRGEMMLVVDTPEDLGFVEIFSEQGMRLLMLHVQPPPHGAGKQSARMELSSGRTVEAHLNFSGVHPVLLVSYKDPELSREEVGEVSAAPDAPAKQIAVPFANSPNETVTLFGSIKAWFEPMRIAVIASLLFAALLGFLLLDHPGRVDPPPTPRVVLKQARDAEFALAPTEDRTLHRNYQVEEWSDGDLRSRRRVDEWLMPRKTARRTYDERGEVIAGIWTSEDGRRRIFKQGEKLKTEYGGGGEPAKLPEPTANAFANLTDRHGVTSRVAIEEGDGTYKLTFEDRKGETEQAGVSERLIAAMLTLDRETLMPVSQSIVLQIGGETLEYRYSDIRLERKPSADVEPIIFEPEAELAKGATRVVKPLEIEAPPAPEAALADPLPSSISASLETEVELMRALDGVNALSGDQISVTRSASGRLKIVGIVDSTARKAEILNALSEVRNAPGVSIDIQTAREAASRRGPPPDSRIGEVQIDSVAASARQQIAVEAELRAYFLRRGSSEDAVNTEIRTFAASVLDRSEKLSRNALSLKSLAERFSAAEIERIEPKKREEWRGLIRSKASAVAGDIRSLRSQLSQVFDPQASGSGNAAAVDSADEAAQRLFGLAAACERQVNQSFAVMAGGGSPAVKTVQFWRNLSQMAAIANELQKF